VLAAFARRGRMGVGVVRRRKAPAMRNIRAHRWTRDVGGGESSMVSGSSTTWKSLVVAMISQSGWVESLVGF